MSHAWNKRKKNRKKGKRKSPKKPSPAPKKPSPAPKKPSAAPKKPSPVRNYRSDNTRFEATLEDGDVFKKIMTAIGDLVQNANFDCGYEGIRLQEMDSSHVA
eukprot:67331_1